MKYMIAFLIKDEAKEYQMKLMNELSKEFGLKNPLERIMPHLTLKSPFYMPEERIEEVISMVENFAKNNNSEKITSKGFGNFDKRIFFIGYHFSEQAYSLYREFIQKFGELKLVELDKLDGKGEFHATLAYLISPDPFSNVKEKLSKMKIPEFEMKLDNIALLEKPNDKWQILREFKIGK